MNFNQERYFFLSGLISLSLFTMLLFFAGYTLIFSPKTEQFAMNKSDVINVSISMSDIKTTEQNDPKPQVEPQPEITPDSVIQPPALPVVQKESVPEISDLFAQVKPQKIVKKPLEVTKSSEQLNALEKELLTHKETPRFSDKVSKVELVKPSVKMAMQGGSTGPNVDKYKAKIQGLVEANFHPPSGSGGETAVVLLRIDSMGKMVTFRILKNSKNESFNDEVNWLKDRLSSIRFPDSPDGNEGVLTCTLTAKE
jgi:protein TonB